MAINRVMNSIHYIQILLIALNILLVLQVVAGYLRWQVSSKYQAGLIIGNIMWTIGAVLEKSVSVESGAIFWSGFSFLGVIFNPVMLFLFIAEYCNTINFIKKKILKFIFVIPSIVITALVTNRYHNLFVTDFAWHKGALSYQFGPLFWLMVAYLWFLIAGCILTICYSLFKMSQNNKKQLFVLLAICLIIVLSNFAYIVRINGLSDYDFTPVAFILSSAFILIMSNKNCFVELLPLAHNFVFSKIKAGILILDNQNRVVEYNDNVNRQLNDANLCIGYNISDLPERYAMIRDICMQNSFYENEIMIRSDAPEYYEMSIDEIFNDNNLSGKIVMLYNITHQKKVEKQLKIGNNLLKDRLFQIEQLQLKLGEQAFKDPLTGLYNRKFLYDGIAKEISRSEREKCGFALAAVELDNFNSIDNHYGQSAGDRVMVEISNVIADTIRKTDYICRFDSGTLVLIMTKINEKDISEKMKRIVDKIASLKFSTISEGILLVSHFGFALYPQNGRTHTELFSKIEKMLRESKEHSLKRSIIPEN